MNPEGAADGNPGLKNLGKIHKTTLSQKRSKHIMVSPQTSPDCTLTVQSFKSYIYFYNQTVQSNIPPCFASEGSYQGKQPLPYMDIHVGGCM